MDNGIKLALSFFMQKICILILLLCFCFADVHAQNDTPTTIVEYNKTLKQLNKKKVGYFYIQTMRERVLIKNWDNEELRKEVIQDYLKSFLLENKNHEYLLKKFENSKYETYQEFFELLEQSVPNGWNFSVSNKSLPLIVTDLQIDFFQNKESNYIQLKGSINGGRKRKISSIDYKISKNGKDLYINYMSTAEALRGRGYSELLFNALLEQYPSVEKISTEFVDTNLSVFKNVMSSSLGYSDVDEGIEALKKIASGPTTNFGIDDAQNPYKQKQITVYLVNNNADSDFAQAIISGIQATPSHKIRSKLGFIFDHSLVDLNYTKKMLRRATWIKSSAQNTPENSLFPLHKYTNNEDLRANIYWSVLSAVFSNELNPQLLKPVTENLEEGVYISVGGETALITTAILPKTTHALFLDMDPMVVLYNRWKLGMIGISNSKEDLLYLLKKATHAEVVERVNAYTSELPYGVKEALLDAYFFRLFTIYTRKEGVMGEYMLKLLHEPSSGDPYYKANYHFYDDQYKKLHSLVISNKISAHLADLTDNQTITEIVKLLEDKNLKVSALNLSDTWMYKSLFKDKKTINNKAITEYDSSNFDALINAFKSVIDGSSVLIQSKSIPEADLSYVVFNFNKLYDLNTALIPNYMYLRLDKKYNKQFKKGGLLIDPSIDLQEMNDEAPLVILPQKSSDVGTYMDRPVNWESLKGKKVLIRYKDNTEVEQDVLSYQMLAPELFEAGRKLFKETYNSFGFFREVSIVVIRTDDGYFLSDVIKGKNSGVSVKDISKAIDVLLYNNDLNKDDIKELHVMHTHPDGEPNAHPLSKPDIEIDFEHILLSGPIDIYAIPVQLKGNIIFHKKINQNELINTVSSTSEVNEFKSKVSDLAWPQDKVSLSAKEAMEILSSNTGLSSNELMEHLEVLMERWSDKGLVLTESDKYLLFGRYGKKGIYDFAYRQMLEGGEQITEDVKFFLILSGSVAWYNQELSGSSFGNIGVQAADLIVDSYVSFGILGQEPTLNNCFISENMSRRPYLINKYSIEFFNAELNAIRNYYKTTLIKK